MNSLNRFADPVYCIMRLVVGLNFASHGGRLLFGKFGGMPGSDTPLLQLCGWICLVGWFVVAFVVLTRLAAFISCGTIVVGFFMGYLLRSFFPVVNEGRTALYTVCSVLFVF